MKVVLLILIVNFICLEDEFKFIEEGLDYIYVDVMDGYFVLNISFGLVIVL